MRPYLFSFMIALPACAWCDDTPSSNSALNGTYTLDPGGGVLDGGKLLNSTGYFLQSGTLNIRNATLQNFTTKGGAGSGGGAGLGGALFINAGATANISNAIFNANTAVGGDGGSGRIGGRLNNLLSATGNGADGSKGDDAPAGAGMENQGNGRNGYTGCLGANAANGYGGSGGSGGKGGPGTPTSAEVVKTAAEIAANAIKLVVDATADTAIAATLPGLEIAIAAVAASGADPLVTPVAEAAAAALEIAAVALSELAAAQVGVSTYDGAMAACQAAYLLVIQTTSYLTDGVAGIGGNGGNGANGGNGSFGFGGGAGGNGGQGGDAVSDSVSSGGIGGNGGNGGKGGFGGGGGMAGSPGQGGTNGTHSSMNNGYLYGTMGNQGLPGFGGGIGSCGDGSENGYGGGGGAGYGGAIFVAQGGTLNINGPASFDDNNAQGGSSLNNGVAGQGVGTDLFMMKGSTVTINPGDGNTVTFNGTIADDSAASIGTAVYSTGQGNGLAVESGLVIFNGVNTYTGTTLISGGVLQAADGTGINSNSNIHLAGGVLQGNGTLNRFLGTQSNRIQWTDSGGFSAAGGDFTVELNNGARLAWGAENFLGDGQNLLFGSSSATSNVYFSNDIDLNGKTRTILAGKNGANTNQAVLQGCLSNGSLDLGDSTHLGTIVLGGANTYTGTTHVKYGKLILQGSLASPNVVVDSGASFQDSSGHLAAGTALTANGTFILNANDTVDSLLGTGTVLLNSAVLSVNSGTFSGGISSSDNTSGLTKATDGTLTLSGNHTFLGPTVVNGGKLLIEGGYSSRTLNISEGGTLEVNAGTLSTLAVANVAGTMVLDSNETIDALNGSGYLQLKSSTLTLNQGSFSGVISENGSLKKTSTETLALSGANTFTGTAWVDQGTLDLTGSLTCSQINIASGAVLEDENGGLSTETQVANFGTINLGADDTVKSIVNTGTITGGYTLTALTYDLQDGSNIYSNLGAGSMSTSGSVNLYGTSDSENVSVLSGSTLNLMGAQLLPNTSTVNLDGVISLNGGDQVVHVLNGTGTVKVNAYNFSVCGGGNFTGHFDGPSTQLNAQGGELSLNDGTVNTDHLNLSNGVIVNVSGSGNTTNTNNVTVGQESTLNVMNNSTLNNAGDVVVHENAMLCISNGSSFINVGNMHVNTNGTLCVDAGGVLAVNIINTASNSTVIVPDSSNLNYVVLTGNGIVNTQGNTFVNNQKVSGFITILGNFNNNGILAPGNSPGMITIIGDYIDSSELDVQLGNLVPITGYDQVRIGGVVTLLPSSVLVAEVYDGIQPVKGNVYQILADSLGNPIQASGTFGSLFFDPSGGTNPAERVKNAAFLFDVASGQLIATGLNSPTSSFADLGSNGNQSEIALKFFDAAQIGQNQIDTRTLKGFFAKQILTYDGGVSNGLDFFTPYYYGAANQFAENGDRALVREVWNTLTEFQHPLSSCCSNECGFSLFGGTLLNRVHLPQKITVHRADYYAGVDYDTGRSFCLGAAGSFIQGGIHNKLGSDNPEGGSVLLYARKLIGSGLKTFLSFLCSSQRNQLSRPTLNGKVEGSTRTNDWVGCLAMEYEECSLWNVSISPRCSVVYSYSQANGFKEKGAIDALKLGEHSSSLLTGEIGVSAVYCTSMFNRGLKCELIGGLEQVFLSNDGKMDVHLVQSPDVAYSLKFRKEGRTAGRYEANFAYDLCENLTLFGGYKGAVKNNVWEHYAGAGVSVNLDIFSR